MPFTALASRFPVGSTKTMYIERTQYPLTLAWSATIHKVQGQTLDKVVASFDGGRFTAGQAYVALSRVKSLSGLHLRSFDPEKIKVNKTALIEMERMRQQSLFQWKPNIATLQEQDYTLLLHLNIRSFQAHEKDFLKDQTLQCADLISMTEAYLQLDHYNFREEYVFYNNKTLHGIIAFVRKSLHPTRLQYLESSTIETLVLQIELCTCKTIVIVCYKPPKQPLKTFTSALASQLQLLPPWDPVILLGDFNSDIYLQSPLPGFLSNLGFQQHVTDPTHRFGGLLDHIYTRNIQLSRTETHFCYYSDHTVP